MNKPYTDLFWTAQGEPRAEVAFKSLKTLWINTGTLCNIECSGCYIASSPTNDALVYFQPSDLIPYLDEVANLAPGSIEIGFTGGEPFLNPHMPELIDLTASREHRVLILTNAMRPMMRAHMREALTKLHLRYGAKISLRVSLDHFSAAMHDSQRGDGAFSSTLQGLDWLNASEISFTIAARRLTHETEAQVRAGFKNLIAAHGWPIDADDPAQLVVFPEIDASKPVPEITSACWGILNVSPDAMMCATSRMVVRRKGADRPAVVACTLLPFDPAFEFGERLAQSLDPVRLGHPNCAQFCVLGGGKCSA